MAERIELSEGAAKHLEAISAGRVKYVSTSSLTIQELISRGFIIVKASTTAAGRAWLSAHEKGASEG